MVTCPLYIINADNQKTPEEENLPTGAGICMRIMIRFRPGILVGYALDSLAFGIAIGVYVGIILGCIIKISEILS